MNSITILSFNAGLLRMSLAGKTFFEPTPYLEERFAHMAPAIRRINADVVALQEVFFDKFRDGLAKELQPAYPHVARVTGHHWPSLGTGLLLFSKHPILHWEFVPFRDIATFGRLTVPKGTLIATMDLPEFARVSVACTHARAEGRMRKESDKVIQGRANNLRTVAKHLRKQQADVRIVAGDLNCGPDNARVNYTLMLANGFRDAVVGTPVEKLHTWDPDTLLNRMGSHGGKGARRIDHVLIDETSEVNVQTASADVVLTEPVVPTPGGMMTLSDHYGVVVRLSRV